MENRSGQWWTVLAMAMLAGSLALAAPATPAVPGGGNPNTDNTHAATPAVPAVDDMDDRDAGDLLGQDPALRDEAKAKWDAMTPEQREQFLKDHPRLAKRMLKRTWDKMTPAERSQFIRNHPELRERLMARWQGMTPEERKAFLDKHPRIAKRAAHRMRTERGERPGKHGDKGVRDHGAGEGRNGVGQGGQHRAPAGGPKK
ncbi:MAG: hypothetical protein AAB152_13265 [Candidatus Coatesbacteria bacterium]